MLFSDHTFYKITKHALFVLLLSLGGVGATMSTDETEKKVSEDAGIDKIIASIKEASKNPDNKQNIKKSWTELDKYLVSAREKGKNRALGKEKEAAIFLL